MSRYNKHKCAKAKLKEIDSNPSQYLFIHYSCESFYNIKNGKPGKISYICRSGNSSDKEKKTLIEGKIIDY